jgi:cobalt/nickel transport system permease protein
MAWSELLYLGGNESDNPINQVDTRLKLVFVLASIVLILASNEPLIALYFTGVSLGLTLLAEVRLDQFMVRLVAPLIVLTTLMIIQSFFYGTTEYLTIPIPGLEPTIYWEGIVRGGIISLRVIAGISLIIVLSLTSSILTLLSALKFFRIPRSWLEIIFLSYRYLFVFVENLQNGYQAQKIRLGYHSVGQSLRSLGMLAGNLFLRIFDQTVKTYNALKLRGYRGDLPVPDVTGQLSVLSTMVAILLYLPGVFLLWL